MSEDQKATNSTTQTAEQLRSDVERLLTVLRFIAQDPKAVSPVQAARDALADYGDQHDR